MNTEQEILNAFERGKGFGFAEGMKMMRLKELTDEEINEIVWQQNLLISNDGLRNFAKAILKKASEK